MSTSPSPPSSGSLDQPAGTTRDISKPRVRLSNLRGIRARDYVIRFLFGGTISVLAAVIGQGVNPRFGGVFTAFPAILLASLTLIGKEEGVEQAAQDAEGGVLGASAFCAAAIFLALTLRVLIGALALALALALWSALAISLYVLCLRAGILHSYSRAQPRDDARAGANP